MSWVEEEFETLNLGDKRLNRRAMTILDRLGLAPGRTIPQAFRAWSEMKACYNFFDNPSILDESLLEPHIEKTLERIKDHAVVLLPSDTTEIDYSSKVAMKGKERLTNTKSGIWLHSTIAVTPNRLTLGIIEANFWNRQPEVGENSSSYRTARDKAPIEEKETFRWLQNYKKACEVAREAPDSQIINIMDREADIIEIFEEAWKQEQQGPAAKFIVRSQYDRRLIEDDEAQIYTKLRQRLKDADALGEVEFTIPSTDKRKGRKVKQQLKALSVVLKPANKDVKIQVNAVMAIESNPPSGEDPLTWAFITNLDVNIFEDAKKVIEYYLCRWEIELFFKVLKSGCKIEERQLQTTDRMKRLISVFMVLSWRVMFTMMLGRVASDMSCGDVFEEAEWKAVWRIVKTKKALPRKPPALGDFIIMVATLGGYVERKGGEPPGVKTMWKGMARMIDFAIAWEAFGR
jgi:hypothetical protein